MEYCNEVNTTPATFGIQLAALLERGSGSMIDQTPQGFERWQSMGCWTSPASGRHPATHVAERIRFLRRNEVDAPTAEQSASQSQLVRPSRHM
jgi:hypothetical protein